MLASEFSVPEGARLTAGGDANPPDNDHAPLRSSSAPSSRGCSGRTTEPIMLEDSKGLGTWVDRGPLIHLPAKCSRSCYMTLDVEQLR